MHYASDFTLKLSYWSYSPRRKCFVFGLEHKYSLVYYVSCSKQLCYTSLQFNTIYWGLHALELFRLLINIIRTGGFLSDLDRIVLRSPSLEDGMAVFRLVENCPPLDINSGYCNLLQCSHFANTSVVAQMNGEVVGFISGYVIPEHSDTLFVWQVAVAEQARGLGLASHMLAHILARPHCADIGYLETSITQDNHASWALFKSLAKKLSADFQSSEWMDNEAHFSGQHDSEALVRIGPFKSHS